MQYSSVILLAAFAATNVFAHGVIDSVVGANGVTMPGLSGKLIRPHLPLADADSIQSPMELLVIALPQRADLKRIPP